MVLLPTKDSSNCLSIRLSILILIATFITLILQMRKLRNGAFKLTSHRLFSQKMIELGVPAYKQHARLQFNGVSTSDLKG